MDNKTILILLEHFISFLKKLDESELEGLKNGSLQISFVKESKRAKVAKSSAFQAGMFISKLLQCQNREECEKIIREAKLRKSDMEEVLKTLDVAFTKRDTKMRLQSKILENTIGKKLRSEAIINK